jgi:phosphatidylglycerophosphate synthase
MTREIITLPFWMFARRFDVRVNVRKIGKTMTGLQSVIVPWLLLSLPFATLLIVITAIVGIFSGIDYAKSSFKPFKEEK